VSRDIPYASTPRPDTGVSNATLGVWLFIASEVMLFGSLFSSYALLRNGARGWPDQTTALNTEIASVNTVVVVLSFVAMMGAARSARLGDRVRLRQRLSAAIVLGLMFLAYKELEYAGEIDAGLVPSSHVFFGLYYAITGVHALHVIGGIVVNAYLLWTMPTAVREPRFASRVMTTATYWGFIDVVWLAIFVVLYVM
jgi:heme/copper-type cytochrome/quinol oxidase subunit 3